MTLPSTETALSWIGLPVHDDTGTPLGECRNVYADDDTRLPEWVEVELADGGVAFAPALGASSSHGVLRLTHSRTAVDGAPRFAGDVDLSAEAERALYEHYGVPYSSERSETLLPAAADLPRDDVPAPPAGRLHPVERPAPTPAPPPPLPVRDPAPPSSPGIPRWLALLAAVAAALLAARRLRAGRQDPSVPPAPAAGLLAVLVVGAAAVGRRRRRRSGPAPNVVPVEAVVDRRTHTPV